MSGWHSNDLGRNEILLISSLRKKSWNSDTVKTASFSLSTGNSHELPNRIQGDENSFFFFFGSFFLLDSLFLSVLREVVSGDMAAFWCGVKFSVGRQ